MIIQYNIITLYPIRKKSNL